MKDYFEHYPDKTCLIYRDEQLIFSSTDQGVKPMMMYMKAYGASEEPLTIVDRIMGKGAVLLAIAINATKIITPIISEPALALAEKYNLEVLAQKKVAYIINRTGDGRCPIESAVLAIDNIDEGYKAIQEAIGILMSGND